MVRCQHVSVLDRRFWPSGPVSVCCNNTWANTFQSVVLHCCPVQLSGGPSASVIVRGPGPAASEDSGKTRAEEQLELWWEMRHAGKGCGSTPTSVSGFWTGLWTRSGTATTIIGATLASTRCYSGPIRVNVEKPWRSDGENTTVVFKSFMQQKFDFYVLFYHKIHFRKMNLCFQSFLVILCYCFYIVLSWMFSFLQS